ncbi:hypothetical protein [Dactylosporangium cerinum]
MMAVMMVPAKASQMLSLVWSRCGRTVFWGGGPHWFGAMIPRCVHIDGYVVDRGL